MSSFRWSAQRQKVMKTEVMQCAQDITSMVTRHEENTNHWYDKNKKQMKCIDVVMTLRNSC